MLLYDKRVNLSCFIIMKELTYTDPLQWYSSFIPAPLQWNGSFYFCRSYRYDVSGYPTLKWFRDGQPYDYDGPRDEEGIYEYMRQRSSPDWKPPPAAVLTLTQDNFTDFINNNALSLVEFYAPWYVLMCKYLELPIITTSLSVTFQLLLFSKYCICNFVNKSECVCTKVQFEPWNQIHWGI